MEPTTERDLSEQRIRMVADQLKSRDVDDPAVLAAMTRVPRHHFVPGDMTAHAYDDAPLPIGWGQTISQPYVVAEMTALAQIAPESRILEIGTGCGYQTAVLAELAREVYSIEIVAELQEHAAETLDRLGYRNIHLRRGDGHSGWPEAAPFDAIVVTAAPPTIPPALLEQLELGGRMVIPVGIERQQIRLVTRSGASSWTEQTLFPVRFVPLTREHAPRSLD